MTKLWPAVPCILIAGCSAMPGMQNINTHNIQTMHIQETIAFHPVLIPVTRQLLTAKKLSRYQYQIAPADVLSIHVWQHPEFDFLEKNNASSGINAGVQGAAGISGYLVHSNGNIYFPLIGYQHVAGKTMEAVQSLLTEKLQEYIKNPQLVVRVSDYRGQKVYVLGEVHKPGFLPITDQPLTVADAITLSGSLDSQSADLRYIFVIRGSLHKPRIYWLDLKTADKMLLAEHFWLQPKDILYVSSAPVTRWNRVLNQILPTVQTVWYTQAIATNV